MNEVVGFTGKTVDNHRELAKCGCGCCSFKIVMVGSSRKPSVQCANCENVHEWIEVKGLPE